MGFAAGDDDRVTAPRHQPRRSRARMPSTRIILLIVAVLALVLLWLVALGAGAPGERRPLHRAWCPPPTGPG
ncbi:MAG: hypothetical protein U0531_06770 [Dehalococcoidia bacterium]